MPYFEYAEYPNCGKYEIEEMFGYRNMGDGCIIPQSWCRDCRSSGSDDEYDD